MQPGVEEAHVPAPKVQGTSVGAFNRTNKDKAGAGKKKVKKFSGIISHQKQKKLGTKREI